MFTRPGYNYQISSINLLFITGCDHICFRYLCFDILQKITDYYLFSMFLTETKVKQLFVCFVVIFQ